MRLVSTRVPRRLRTQGFASRGLVAALGLTALLASLSGCGTMMCDCGCMPSVHVTATDAASGAALSDFTVEVVSTPEGADVSGYEASVQCADSEGKYTCSFGSKVGKYTALIHLEGYFSQSIRLELDEQGGDCCGFCPKEMDVGAQLDRL